MRTQRRRLGDWTVDRQHRRKKKKKKAEKQVGSTFGGEGESKNNENLS